MAKVTMMKYNGDDCRSWAVFKDNHPVVTGLSRREASYYKKQVEEMVRKKEKDEIKGSPGGWTFSGPTASKIGNILKGGKG